ncbi:hypothetical protein POJ06DRAFT_281596 [Lipomyces tetrasporus]|uniref:Phospholipid/glycerol acyltransferase domain-containing protein n=1 Tax=Lipomyces tetrasporus TaxID=54092 RepID=A0AAD7QSQ2_9ASCO|nr:uncharacterized protein POJ06DRAFT_281596 [Lipomyces tetrasporus]KAJ8100608.1 hypothetical protein POJ06DRAFT_281596 [Lipomyces tetrasporus]
METLPPRQIVKSLTLAVSAILDILLSSFTLAVVNYFVKYAPTTSISLSVMISASLWGYLFYIVETIKKIQISFSGDVLEPDTSAILICNHRSYGDYILIYALSTIYGMRGRCRFLVWRALYSVPSIYWLFSSLWVAQDWTFDTADQKEAIMSQLTTSRYWLVLFPETVKFSLDIAYEHIRYCKANGLPVLSHCLYPRFEGFVPIMKHLLKESEFKLVYDVTFIYRRNDDLLDEPATVAKAEESQDNSGEGQSEPKVRNSINEVKAAVRENKTLAPSLRDIILGKSGSWEFHVHVQRISIMQIPSNRRGLEKWLEKLWVKKDKLLDGVDKKGMSYKSLGYVYFAGDEIFANEEQDAR